MFLAIAQATVLAQQTVGKHYNTADGLPHNIIGQIYQDERGFIWFATAGGLSRFDGYRFTNYTKADGLPGDVVTSITEDRSGRLWVGTTGGIARLVDDPTEAIGTQRAPGPRKKFVTYQVGTTNDSNAVSNILFDKTGALWCTSDEIYRALPNPDGKLDFQVAITHRGTWTSFRVLQDTQGHLWFGLLRELIEYVDGEIIRYGPAQGLPMEQTHSRAAPNIFNEQIIGLAEDAQHRILLANRRNVFEFVPAAGNGGPRGLWQKLPLELNADREIRSLGVDSQAQILIGTTKGLIRYNQKEGQTSGSFDGEWIFALLQDHEANLWVSVMRDGIYKSARDAIVKFTKTDGIPGQGAQSLAEGPPGTIYYATATSGVVAIKNDHVEPVRGSQSFSAAHFVDFLHRDARGNYWVGTHDGLYYFRGPELNLERGEKIVSHNQSPAGRIFGVAWYQAPDATIWCGSGGDQALYMLPPNSAEKKFQRIGLERTRKGHALDTLHCASADRKGDVWFGWQADLSRYRNGRLEVIEVPDLEGDIEPRAMYTDSRGWLWIGTGGNGVVMTRDPTAETPQFVNYRTHNGLTDDSIFNLAQDDSGRMYFATLKGFDLLDVDTGKIKQVTVSDSAGNAGAGFTMKDSEGNIWTASGIGVARLNPRLEAPAAAPPPVYFRHVQIAGEDLSVAERGVQHIAGLELPAARNNLLIEFLSVDLRDEHEVRYQYKLEDIDHDWTAASDQRLLNFARLPPGSYRLLVRSVNADGVANQNPSVMEFRILPPIWQRWWFIALVLLTTGILLWLAHRYRVAHLMELERTRLSIARDLHDEIGSGLGSIGILSALAVEDDVDELERKTLAKKIALASGELGQTLTEIVWALRHESETLEALAHHLTERGARLFPSLTTEFQTDFPAAFPDIRLSMTVRRNLQLIAIEALHNAMKHSQAKQVTLSIVPEGRNWRLTVSDDGTGFAESTNGRGMGLKNMRRRAADIGAQMDLQTAIGRGTKVSVVFDPQAKVKP
jgi:signal transduction histidine kinase/streptogramin lyase